MSKAIKSDIAKQKIKGVANRYLDQALDSFTTDLSKKLNPLHSGGAVDIQKQLAKLGKLHLRTPTGKKYNYCGPGTKLGERLASSNPNYRDPIYNLDAICQQHDIAYSEAGDNLSKKHAADKIMEDSIKAIPFNQRPWFATPTMYAIKTKRKLGLGVPKNGKSRPVNKTGK